MTEPNGLKTKTAHGGIVKKAMLIGANGKSEKQIFDTH